MQKALVLCDYRYNIVALRTYGLRATRGSMAQIDIPDDPAWRRLFKALNKAAQRRGRISRECRVEMFAGKTGVKTVIVEEDFSPDE